MRNYQQTIAELGMTKSSFSKSLNKAIKEYEEAILEYEGLIEARDNMEPDDEGREDVEAEIKDYEKVLADEDEKISKRIKSYVENKPFHEEKMRQIRAGMKVSGQTAKNFNQPDKETTTVTTAEMPVGNTVVVNTQGQLESQGASAVAEPVVVEEKKEKTNWVLWGTLGLLGLIVGVNVMKNRNN